MSKSEAKELKKNLFRLNNKLEKEISLFKKIVDKVSKSNLESEKYDALLKEIEKYLLKTKDGVQARIRGNALDTLGYPDLAKMFYDKATELGYIVENVQEDEDLETETKIKEKLIGKKILIISSSPKDKEATIVDCALNYEGINIILDNGKTYSMTYKEISNFLNGFQIVKTSTTNKKFAIVLEEPVLAEKKKINENMELNQENLDSLINKKINVGYFGFTNNFTIKNIELTNENYYRINLIEDDSAHFLLEQTELENLLNNIEINSDMYYFDDSDDSNKEEKNVELALESCTTKNCDCVDLDCDCVDLDCDCVVEAVGTWDLELDIANEILPMIKNKKAQTGTFTVQDLEEYILNHGGNLEMVDKVMANLVDLGFDFDNDIENELEDNLDIDNAELISYPEGGLGEIGEGLDHRVEETEDTGTFIKLKFNPHTVHNPDYDIVEGWINKYTFITYAINIKTHEESMEYYTGDNYAGSNGIKSFSRHFAFNKIPNKYKNKWLELKTFYINKFKPMLESFKQQMPLMDEFKNYNLFDLDIEKDTKEYDPDAVAKLVQADPFLKFSYNELNTGDYEKDMNYIFKTYVKGNPDLESKLKTFE